METIRSRNIRVWGMVKGRRWWDVGGEACTFPYILRPTSCVLLLASLSDRDSHVLENLARDDQPVDLAGALVDLGDAGVAEVALDRILLGVAVAAVNLESLGRDPLSHLGGEELGDRRLQPVAAAPAGLLLRRRGSAGQKARGVDLGGHVRQIKADHLEIGDRAGERPALAGVPHRSLVGLLRDPDGLGGDADTAAVESGHG